MLKMLVKYSLSIIVLLLLPVTVEAKIIYKERSLYQNVYVADENKMICLRFKVKNKNDLSQSCIYKTDPNRLVFNYYKQAMATTFFTDKPKNILIIGLGGGVLANTFTELYPETHVTSVEIDPVVVKMARKYFNYNDEDPRLTTHVQDGRVFVKRAIKKQMKYDLILLDAFTGDYIPEHLMTQEYLEEVKQLVTDDGFIMANTFSTSKLFDHESATYHKVFGDIYQVFIEDAKTNRVIIAAKNRLPSKKQILDKANKMNIQLQPYGVDAFAIFEAISDEINWDINAKVLTDQYSPANLLKGK